MDPFSALESQKPTPHPTPKAQLKDRGAIFSDNLKVTIKTSKPLFPCYACQPTVLSDFYTLQSTPRPL